ncbi:MAG: 6-bladed beta-propeller [Lentimicrobiaceae bacterium]|jgi:hypothetical protein|nr:6-bladed beta-propeller [Lentimicrobiaceae bacterium]
MKKKITFIIISATLLLVCSCTDLKNKADKKEIVSEVIKVNDEKDRGKTIASDIFPLFDFIKLETNDEAIFGNIERIIFYNDRIFILDSEVAGKLLVFDRSGKYITTVGGKGKGPGEIIYPMDFYIDTLKKTINILDMGTSIKVYSLATDCFEILNSSEIPATIGSFKTAPLPDNKRAFITGGKNPELCIADKSFKNLDFYFPYTSRKFSILLREGLNYGNKNVIFRRYANDTIYNLSEGKPTPYRVFDFNQPVSYNELVNLSESAQNEMLTKYSLINLYFESDSQFYLKYSINSKEFFYLRNPKGEIYHFSKEKINNDLFGTKNLYCIGVDQYTKSFVFMITPSYLLKLVQTKPESLHPESLNKLNQLHLKEDDNYVLVMLKM